MDRNFQGGIVLFDVQRIGSRYTCVADMHMEARLMGLDPDTATVHDLQSELERRGLNTYLGREVRGASA